MISQTNTEVIAHLLKHYYQGNSPVELLNTLARGTMQLRQGKLTTTEYIDGLASGLTGTAIFALGAFLQSIGALEGSLGTEPEDEFAQLAGDQSYSIRLFGKSYTIDWMAPAAMPLFAGVELMKLIKGEYEGATFADAYQAIAGIMEPAFNLSMLDGVNSLLDSASFTDNQITAILETVGTSYTL